MPEVYVIFARKINNIPEFYIIFAPKMPDFYMIVAQQIFSRFFGRFGVGVGTRAPCPTSPTPMPKS